MFYQDAERENEESPEDDNEQPEMILENREEQGCRQRQDGQRERIAETVMVRQFIPQGSVGRIPVEQVLSFGDVVQLVGTDPLVGDIEGWVTNSDR